MKYFIPIIIGLCVSACAMTPAQRKQRFIQGAKACNEICEKNPEVKAYSLDAKGTWVSEERCECHRPAP
mgnify:CR=1 FL=1